MERSRREAVGKRKGAGEKQLGKGRSRRGAVGEKKGAGERQLEKEQEQERGK